SRGELARFSRGSTKYSGGALEDLVENGEVKRALACPAQDPVLYCQKLFRIVLAPSLLLGLNLMQRPQKIWRVRGVADRSSLGIVSLVAGRDSPLPTWPPSRSIPTGRYH